MSSALRRSPPVVTRETRQRNAVENVESGEHPAFEPYVSVEAENVVRIDGLVTITHLKAIVTAMESA